MRKRIITVLLGLTLAIIMLFGLLPACGGGTTSPTPTASVIGGQTVAPVAQGKTWRWRYQSNANAGTATYWITEEYVANIMEATGNRLVLDLAPQGAIVGSLEIFDAVATGAIEMGAN